MLIANELNILFHILRTFYSRSSAMSHRNINIDMQILQSLEFASYQVDFITQHALQREVSEVTVSVTWKHQV